MDEAPSTHLNSNDETLLRLDKLNKIEDYFITDIKEREIASKRLSKYIAAFYYIDKTLIVLSAPSRGVSIAVFASVIGAPVGKASANFSFAFSSTAEIIKKILKAPRNKKQKNIIRLLLLARSKLNSIEMLTYKALIDRKISHEEYIIIINKEQKYRRKKKILES